MSCYLAFTRGTKEYSLLCCGLLCIRNPGASALLRGSCCAHLQDVKGKVAVVIGASTGLGRGVADRLAAGGMRVRKCILYV
jgi:5,10-methylene-tetrahydrofolate dehydrogenase/methenyl tetrahydrofolate cyclohydrolase